MARSSVVRLGVVSGVIACRRNQSHHGARFGLAEGWSIDRGGLAISDFGYLPAGRRDRPAVPDDRRRYRSRSEPGGRAAAFAYAAKARQALMAVDDGFGHRQVGSLSVVNSSACFSRGY